MFKKILILVFCSLFLQSCIGNFRDYFKRSANNKLIDTKGFSGGKRRPLYNKKYISVAKKNIAESNYEEDEDSSLEEMSPSRINREMYKEMLRKDAIRNKNQQIRRSKSVEKEHYPSLHTAKIKSSISPVNEDELQRELQEIKHMLNETKKDLVKYKCPTNEKTKKKRVDDSVQKFID